MAWPPKPLDLNLLEAIVEALDGRDDWYTPGNSESCQEMLESLPRLIQAARENEGLKVRLKACAVIIDSVRGSLNEAEGWTQWAAIA